MPEIAIEKSTEREAPERSEHPLEIDYEEIAAYSHNPRCYYWEYWLGMKPQMTQKELFERVLREQLRAVYDSEEAHQHIAYTDPSEWRNASRLKQAINAYTTRSPQRDSWDRLQGPKYLTRPLGSTLVYSGRLDASVLVRGVLWFVVHKLSEHRTDSDAFIDRFRGSAEFLGSHWLGHHAWRLMKESGVIQGDTRYGGIILDGIQMSKTIDRRVSTFLTPSPWQIEQFVRNAYVLGEEILRRRDLTRSHIKYGEPARNAFPNWGDSMFCPWKALNVAENTLQEEIFLETCTVDPCWERRET